MGIQERIASCRAAARLLPEPLQRQVLACSPQLQAQTEEFRLRIGRPLTLLGPEGEQPLQTGPVAEQDLQAVLDRATEFSAYRCADSIRQGYVAVQGGCRVGLCGTAVLRGGEIATVQALSSVSVRVAKAVQGCAADLYPQLWTAGRFESTLLIAPPGGGKTTLLRDLIRLLSDGDEGHAPLRLSVVDERGEVAAVCGGRPQFDVGRHTDVLSGAPKAEGILMLLWNGVPQLDVGERTDVLEGCPKVQALMMLLRAMNPQVIAVDEITAPEDIRTMLLAANCGVSFLATVHGADLQELRHRRICRELLETELFHQFVVLEKREGTRGYRVERC